MRWRWMQRESAFDWLKWDAFGKLWLIHDISWASPIKHLALLKLWITLSHDFLFLPKGDRHSLRTEGAAKLQHLSEESSELRCATGPGSSGSMECKLGRKAVMEGWRKTQEKEENGAQKSMGKKDKMTSFRAENVRVFMLGIFASQHWQTHFFTEDAESKGVNEMSECGLSVDRMCNEQMAGLHISDHPWGPFQVLVFSHTFAKILISSLMYQTHWLPFIHFQSDSTVIVAGLWKPKVEITGQENDFCPASDMKHLPFCFYTETREVTLRLRDRKEYPLKIFSQFLSGQESWKSHIVAQMSLGKPKALE